MEQALLMDVEDSNTSHNPITAQCSDATIRIAKVLNQQDELNRTAKSKIRVKIQKYNELSMRGNSVPRIKPQKSLSPLQSTAPLKNRFVNVDQAFVNKISFKKQFQVGRYITGLNNYTAESAKIIPRVTSQNSPINQSIEDQVSRIRESLESNGLDKESQRIDFICDRIQKKLLKKQQLSDAQQSVKYIRHKLKGSELQAHIRGIRQSSIDIQQQGQIEWLKKTKHQGVVNGGQTRNLRLDFNIPQKNLHEFKFFQSVDKQLGLHHQNSTQPLEDIGQIDIRLPTDQTQTLNVSPQRSLIVQSPQSKASPSRPRATDDVKHLGDYLSSPEQKKPPRPKTLMVHQKDLEREEIQAKLRNQWERSNKLHYLRLSKGIRMPSAMEIQANYSSVSACRLPTATVNHSKKVNRQSTISNMNDKVQDEAFFKNDIINSYSQVNTNTGFDGNSTMTMTVSSKMNQTPVKKQMKNAWSSPGMDNNENYNCSITVSKGAKQFRYPPNRKQGQIGPFAKNFDTLRIKRAPSHKNHFRQDLGPNFQFQHKTIPIQTGPEIERPRTQQRIVLKQEHLHTGGKKKKLPDLSNKNDWSHNNLPNPSLDEERAPTVLYSSQGPSKSNNNLSDQEINVNPFRL